MKSILSGLYPILPSSTGGFIPSGAIQLSAARSGSTAPTASGGGQPFSPSGFQKMTVDDKRLAILEKILDGYFELDRSGRVTFCNGALMALLQYSPGEIAGLSVAELLNPEQFDLFQKMLLRLAAGSTDRESFVVELIRQDRRPVQVDGIIAPLKNGGDDIIGYHGAVRDITRQQALEEERRHLEEELRQAKKLEALGQLAGGVAHDFNNLLTGINGYANLMLMQTGEHPHLQSYLKKIEELGNRAARLTQQLLAFSRRQPLSPVVLNLNALIENLSTMLPRILGEDVALRLECAPDLWPIKADPSQMDQILLNLAVNARDAMPQGGRITIRTENFRLDQAFAEHHPGARPGDYVLIIFSDTGCGMDPETQEHVFEPFFTTKEPGRGTGLGLAMVYGIVKQHGGNIWVHSKLRQGTTLQIFLPRCDGTAVGLSPRAPEASPPRGREAILVVEDEEVVRSFIREILEKMGYRVFTAADPEKAEAVFYPNRDRIDLLISDMVMPGGNGRDLYARLSQRSPGLKVLFISGYPKQAIIDNGILELQMPFLSKPFSAEKLCWKIREILDDGLTGLSLNGPATG